MLVVARLIRLFSVSLEIQLSASLGCFSLKGFRHLQLFSVKLDTSKLAEIYKKALLPIIRRQFTLSRAESCRRVMTRSMAVCKLQAPASIDSQKETLNFWSWVDRAIAIK